MTEKVKCAKCEKDIAEVGKSEGGYSILNSAGDEVLSNYYFCNNCRIFTVRLFYDEFLGDSGVAYASVSEEDGKKKLKMISECPDPYDKHCRCNAHEFLGRNFGK